MSWEIRQGNCLQLLQAMLADSVHCVVTSPPYWGLRAYKTEPQVWGGEAGHEHDRQVSKLPHTKNARQGSTEIRKHPTLASQEHAVSGSCCSCGAWRGELGLEPTPELYVQHLVEIFREVKRILRKDGTCWINIASSYCSGIIESNDSIIRRDINSEDRKKIVQALSSVWSSYAPAESALSELLVTISPETTALYSASMSKVRATVHRPQNPRRTRTGKVLLPILCEIREPDEKKDFANRPMSNLPTTIQQVPVRDSEKPEGVELLQPGVLVSIQSERQSLLVERGATRTDESAGTALEKGSAQKGQTALPDLPRHSKTGSTPYQTVQDAQKRPMEDRERGNSLSQLPSSTEEQRTGTCRNLHFHRQRSSNDLEYLIFPHSSIPVGFEQFCEPRHVIKPKDDCLIPERLALALQSDGWYFRSMIIWSKPNPMPESVRDRPTKSHEYLFLLTKSPNYYFDQEAVRETAIHAGRIVQYDGTQKNCSAGDETNDRRTLIDRTLTVKSTRNLRTVWTIPTQPFPEAHFATFPEKLVEPCIRAGTSEKGCCARCGAPWEREVAVTYRNDTTTDGRPAKGNHRPETEGEKMTFASGERTRRISATTGWHPTCSCQAETNPCLVLDPFVGSGTTGIVALKLQRDFIGIELNVDYVKMARKRIGEVMPLFEASAPPMPTPALGGTDG